MKTLYITQGNNILVDSENNTANRLKADRTSIDSMYLIDEPMHVVYGTGEYKRELDAEPGDIVLTFYHSEFKDKIIILKKAEEWSNNIMDYREKEQQEKLRWAQAKCEGGDECESDSIN